MRGDELLTKQELPAFFMWAAGEVLRREGQDHESRSALAAEMSMAFNKALLALYPEPSPVSGETILQVISRQMLTFPVPEGAADAEEDDNGKNL